MILKPDAARRALTRRALLVSLAAAALGCGALAAPRPAAKARGGPTASPSPVPATWKQTLPSGATVEVLDVSDPRRSRPGWWKPDGTPLAGPPFGLPGAAPVTGRDRRVFVMRFTPSPGSGRCQNVCDSAAMYEVSGAATQATGHMRLRDGMPSSRAMMWPGLGLVSAEADALPSRGTVRCGVAVAPWRTLTNQYVIPASGKAESVRLAYQGVPVKILLSRVSEINGAAAVTVTSTLPQRQADWNVVAIDRTGKLYNGSGSVSRIGGEVRREACVFLGLPRKRIRGFQFQVLPHE